MQCCDHFLAKRRVTMNPFITQQHFDEEAVSRMDDEGALTLV